MHGEFGCSCWSDAGGKFRDGEEDYGVDTLKITDDDAAFILGKGGKTKDFQTCHNASETRLRGYQGP